jgi:hypothetical protein
MMLMSLATYGEIERMLDHYGKLAVSKQKPQSGSNNHAGYLLSVAEQDLLLLSPV